MDGRRQGERERLGGIKKVSRLSRDSSTTCTLPSLQLVSNISDSKLNTVHLTQHYTPPLLIAAWSPPAEPNVLVILL